MKDPGKAIAGNIYGRLTAVKYAGKVLNDKACYLCRCECGKEIITKKAYLMSGHTKSCGCLKTDSIHGLCNHRIYSAYLHMISRCYNQKDKKYPRYGGRGITVCDEWKNDRTAYFNWALSNGYEDNLQCDRIDNNGNYSPENCHYVCNRDNSINTGKQINNSSGFVGVTINPSSNRWVSRVKVFGKNIYLGMFFNKIAAAIKRDYYVIDNDLFYYLNFTYCNPAKSNMGWINNTNFIQEIIMAISPKVVIQQGNGIRCPLCHNKTKVYQSVAKPQVNIHGRYRKCESCGTRVYTEEIIIRKIV